MRLGFVIILVCGWCCCCLVVQAQNSANRNTILEELQSTSDGSKGVIRVTSDPKIAGLIGAVWTKDSLSVDSKLPTIRLSGYRVQVFSGNDPRRSREETLSKKQMLEELFPGLTTYVNYISPRWTLRAGDFRTKEEASVCLQELKRAFPSFGKEMYVVKEEWVNIPVNY